MKAKTKSGMIYQKWCYYPIPLTIYPSIHLINSRPLLQRPFTTHFTFSFQFFENFRKDFTIKTNLLCNLTKLAIRIATFVVKNFFHSPNPFINFHYHDFHYSFAIHLPFLYVYIYLSPCSPSLSLSLSLSPKTINSSRNSIKQSIYANKILF
jgi:hypothetical protein